MQYNIFTMYFLYLTLFPDRAHVFVDLSHHCHITQISTESNGKKTCRFQFGCVPSASSLFSEPHRHSKSLLCTII